MSDEKSVPKLGIGAALLAALGGLARCGDDCGRAAPPAAPREHRPQQARRHTPPKKPTLVPRAQ
jgi:hypothetical protein